MCLGYMHVLPFRFVSPFRFCDAARLTLCRHCKVPAILGAAQQVITWIKKYLVHDKALRIARNIKALSTDKGDADSKEMSNAN